KRAGGDEVDVEQDHVERDQHPASAHADGAGLGMQIRPAQVRSRTAGPDVGQAVALPVAVEVDRDLELRPDPLTDCVSNLTALVERGPAERHDGHHVGRADAWTNPAA